MANKIKLINPQKFDVGVSLVNESMGINIKAGSFALVTEDDIGYIASVSTLFKRGILRVEGEEAKEIIGVSGIDFDNNPNYVDDENIKKFLGMSAKKVEEWIETISEPHVLDRIYDMAKGMNLNVSKVKVLQAKMPDKSFLD